ncbi:MAG: thioredoxin family protein, partial [Planctomycetes bacterium]|nr:thioredoxin family protein [Planctomycetota bacterium]
MTCKTVERFVLDSNEVRKAIKAKGAVTLRADMTTENPEASAFLEKLGNRGHSIPYLAIFCADKPNEPRVLADVYTKQQVLDILAECPDPKVPA